MLKSMVLAANEDGDTSSVSLAHTDDTCNSYHSVTNNDPSDCGHGTESCTSSFSSGGSNCSRCEDGHESKTSTVFGSPLLYHSLRRPAARPVKLKILSATSEEEPAVHEKIEGEDETEDDSSPREVPQARKLYVEKHIFPKETAQKVTSFNLNSVFNDVQVISDPLDGALLAAHGRRPISRAQKADETESLQQAQIKAEEIPEVEKDNLDVDVDTKSETVIVGPSENVMKGLENLKTTMNVKGEREENHLKEGNVQVQKERGSSRFSKSISLRCTKASDGSPAILSVSNSFGRESNPPHLLSTPFSLWREGGKPTFWLSNPELERKDGSLKKKDSPPGKLKECSIISKSETKRKTSKAAETKVQLKKPPFSPVTLKNMQETLDSISMIRIVPTDKAGKKGCCQFSNPGEVRTAEDEVLFVTEGGTFSCLCHLSNCCNPLRLKLANTAGESILQFKPPSDEAGTMGKCCCCCFPQEIGVSCLGKFIGSVHLSSSFFCPQFKILDHEHTTVMKVNGPCQLSLFVCCARCSPVFVATGVSTTQGKVAEISRKGQKCCKAYYEKRLPSVETKFMAKISLEDKMLLLAASFFVEHLYSHRNASA